MKKIFWRALSFCLNFRFSFVFIFSSLLIIGAIIAFTAGAMTSNLFFFKTENTKNALTHSFSEEQFKINKILSPDLPLLEKFLYFAFLPKTEDSFRALQTISFQLQQCSSADINSAFETIFKKLNSETQEPSTIQKIELLNQLQLQLQSQIQLQIHLQLATQKRRDTDEK